MAASTQGKPRWFSESRIRTDRGTDSYVWRLKQLHGFCSGESVGTHHRLGELICGGRTSLVTILKTGWYGGSSWSTGAFFNVHYAVFPWRVYYRLDHGPCIQVRFRRVPTREAVLKHILRHDCRSKKKAEQLADDIMTHVKRLLQGYASADNVRYATPPFWEVWVYRCQAMFEFWPWEISHKKGDQELWPRLVTRRYPMLEDFALRVLLVMTWMVWIVLWMVFQAATMLVFAVWFSGWFATYRTYRKLRPLPEGKARAIGPKTTNH